MTTSMDLSNYTIEELFEQLRMLRDENARLNRELDQALFDDVYGVPTRAGFKRRWADLIPQGIDRPDMVLVFVDIDYLHHQNEMHGPDVMDSRIRTALELIQMRASDVLLAVGRYYSGDELVFVVKEGDAVGFAARLKGAFSEQEMGIQVGFATITTNDLRQVVKEAQSTVYSLKRGRK